jgi:hypothetical protein
MIEMTIRDETPAPAESVIETERFHAGEPENDGTVRIVDDEVKVNTSSDEDTSEDTNEEQPRSDYVTSSMKASDSSPTVPSEQPQQAPQPIAPNFKYDEFAFLNDTLQYIVSTYGQHYAHDIQEKGMQVFDLWEGLGSLGSTARDTAIKYLVRYGRKGGHNKKDLMKAIHYIVLLAYATKDQME